MHEIASTAQSNPAAVSLGDLKSLVKNRLLLKKLFRFPNLTVSVYRLDTLLYPFKTAVLMRCLSRGACVIEDEAGQRQLISFVYIFRLACRWARDYFRMKIVLAKTREQVNQLVAENVVAPAVDFSDGVTVYLRTDLAFGLKSGGSIGHTAGVLNMLAASTPKTVFLTTDEIPTVRKDIETHVIRPGNRFWDFVDVLGMSFNAPLVSAALRYLSGRKVAFVYQRHSANAYAGVVLSRRVRAPLVLEYNGSETWVRKNWSWVPLQDAALSARIELLNLQSAELVVVVSQALADELAERGIDRAKILVNPNGIDADRYNPQIDGSKIRASLDLDGKCVVGFIGTFGPWHGAEVLAHAIKIFFDGNPDLKNRVRFLLIGDGPALLAVRMILEQGGVLPYCEMTGLVEQAQGPAYLAACDVLVSPHVPNADGSTFFGSPTKLFEYMAMGKGIVASNLAQIGEILRHRETAWLVEPGNPKELADGILALVSDTHLREKLGAAAHIEAVKNYSWQRHVRRILDQLNTHFLNSDEKLK